MLRQPLTPTSQSGSALPLESGRQEGTDQEKPGRCSKDEPPMSQKRGQLLYYAHKNGLECTSVERLSTSS